MTMIHLRQIHELVAPAVFIDEAAGALTKAERQKDIGVGRAAPLYAKVMNSPPVLIAHASLIANIADGVLAIDGFPGRAGGAREAGSVALQNQPIAARILGGHQSEGVENGTHRSN